LRFRWRKKRRARARKMKTGITTAMAAIPPVERPCCDGEGVGEGEEEEFEVLDGCGCWGMVWLKGIRKLDCFWLD
jgi:hypothetical protein